MSNGLKKYFEQLMQVEGVVIKEVSITSLNQDYQIEIELDNLYSPTGSVELSLLEKFSHTVTENIDQLLTANNQLRQLFPEKLSVNNYSLQISSIGAERELNVPEELERFKGMPLVIDYELKGNREQKIAVYSGRENTQALAETSEVYSFNLYKTKKKGRIKKSNAKTSGQQLENQELALKLNEIKKINLYLDI